MTGDGWTDGQTTDGRGLSTWGTCVCFSVTTLGTAPQEVTRSPFHLSAGKLGKLGTPGGDGQVSAGAQVASGSCCSQPMKSQAQVSGAPQQRPPDAHAWSPPPPANESVTPQSRKVCVVTVSIIYLFTRLQFSACLSNSIIDRELAASRRSAGLRTNSLRQGGLMPGPGEVELAPCGSSGGSRGGGCRGGGSGTGRC